MVYWETVGMSWLCFFIPALWQGATPHANLFFPPLWDATEVTLSFVGLLWQDQTAACQGASPGGFPVQPLENKVDAPLSEA